MSCAWFESLLTLLQICTGLTIMVVESVIIEEEREHTPVVISVLHKEVAVRGACQFVSGLISCIAIYRNTNFPNMLRLITSSMCFLVLIFNIWQCAVGISQILLQCKQYEEACVSGQPLYHSLMLLNTQESMFVIGAITDLTIVIKLSRAILQILSGVQQTQHLNVNDGETSEFDRITYQKVSTVDHD